MKVRVELEVGAQELREFLGLPDVSGLQKDAIEALARRLRSGASSSMDALTVLKSFVPEGLFSLTEWQRLIGRALQTGEPVKVEATLEAPRAGGGRRPGAAKKRGPRKRAS
jgi:hypothetical protein